MGPETRRRRRASDGGGAIGGPGGGNAAPGGGGIGAAGGGAHLLGGGFAPGLGSSCRLGQRPLKVPNSGFGIILGFHSPMLAYQDRAE